MSTATQNKIRVITNNQPREIIDAYQLSKAEQEEFDYLNWEAIEKGEDSASFFRYKGQLHDLGDFVTTATGPFNLGLPEEFAKWDGYASDSFFSGLLVKYTDDCEAVIVALYLS